MAKTAIVTGGSGGIGRSIAKRLAADGFSVAVNYAGKTGEAQAVVDEIKAAGGVAAAIPADISDPDSVRDLFERSEKELGPIYAVVNSAGIMPLSPIEKTSVETFDKVIAVNLRGAFLVLAEAARHVIEGGRIITLSSSVLAKSFPTYGAYIASKSGVEGLVRVLANELRGRNITVNAVAPGPTGTELFFKGKSPEKIAEFAKLSPLERLGMPEDTANAVAFLAGPDGGWINGQVLRANGGFA